MTEALLGTWSVLNPDRGEDLGDDHSWLLTGGTYRLWPAGTAAVEQSYRNRAGLRRDEAWVGTFAADGSGGVRLDLNGGGVEAFAADGPGRLRRVERSRPSRESACLLQLVETFPPPGGTRPGLLPSVFINTLPKSGSRYIAAWLCRSLGLSETKVAVSLFPDDLIVREKFDAFARGGQVCQQHVPAKDINLRFIAARMKRVVIHLRDPRQAMLSWTHHLDNFHAHRDLVPACRIGLEAVTPALPQDYFTRSFEAKLDHQIEYHLPALVAWAERWAEAAGSNPYGLDILFTTHRQLVEQPDELMRAVMGHFGIERCWADLGGPPEKAPDTHFRRGEQEEWRGVMSAPQRERMWACMRGSLAGQFGWQA